MTRSQRRSREATRSLRDLLRLIQPDGRCASCAKKKRLEVDHVDGRTWTIRNLARWARVARYWQEFESGVRLRGLCRSCNARDGARTRYQRNEDGTRGACVRPAASPATFERPSAAEAA